MTSKYIRLSIEKKETIKTFTLEGRSLREISKLMGIGKTTIYYHNKHLTERQVKPFSVNLTDSQIGELIGAFAGDGCYYISRYKECIHHKISYSFSEEKETAYKEYIVPLLRKLNLNPYITHSKRRCIIVQMNSKNFANYILKYLTWETRRSHTVRFRTNTKDYSIEFLKGFARGVMDTESHVSNYNIICACT